MKGFFDSINYIRCAISQRSATLFGWMAGLAFLIVRLAIHDVVGSELRLNEWHQVRNRALDCTDDKKLPHVLDVYHILLLL